MAGGESMSPGGIVLPPGTRSDGTKTLVTGTALGASNILVFPTLISRHRKGAWNLNQKTDANRNGIDWDLFDPSKITDAQALTIKFNAITERAADQAARMFQQENQDDADFTRFINVLWYPEEQQHSAVLMEYLRRFRKDFVPTQEEIDRIDEVKYDENPKLNTLMLHLCGEIRLGEWYAAAAKWHTEPLIKSIYMTLSKDETRHSVAYRDYMLKAMREDTVNARIATISIGYANIFAEDTGANLHPTNMSVNSRGESVQSKLPDPNWLPKWLKSIEFNGSSTTRRILEFQGKILGITGFDRDTLKLVRDELRKQRRGKL